MPMSHALILAALVASAPSGQPDPAVAPSADVVPDASAPVAEAPEPVDGTDEIRRMCEETICQHDVRITLKRADGSVFDETFDVLPGVVQGDMLMIVAGQTLHLEMDVGEQGPTGWRVVDTVRDPAITLTAKFEQMEEGGMMLHLKNPLDRSIKFRMGILPLDGDRLLATSSCPLSAKMGLFEMWPEPILQLMLADARFVGPDERVCE